MQPVHQGQRQPADWVPRTPSQPPASSPAIWNPQLATHSRPGLLASGSVRPSHVPFESLGRPYPQRDQHEQEPEGLAQELPVASWDLSKIPIFPADRPTRLQPASPLIAPSLPGPSQPKLAVGQVDGPLEREADTAADQVMRMPGADASVIAASLHPVQKSVISGPIGPHALHTGHLGSPEATVSEAPGMLHEVLRAPGQPLDAATRAFMEPRFGYDFSRVRVHTDATAAESARSVSAVAYTVGRDVVFGAGQYAPGQEAGRKLLAHELAHTIHQQAAHRGAPWEAVGQSEYDRGSDAPGGAALPRTPIQRLTPQSSSLILRQATQPDEVPPIDRDDPILLQKRMLSNPRSPEQLELDKATQAKLDEFRDRMKASYKYTHTRKSDDATITETATVAPPFAMGSGYDEQKKKALESENKRHLTNITKNHRISQVLNRVQFARGTSEEIQMVTQALIEDGALAEEGSLEHRILQMMFDYRIGTDCAGYVQQAYLSATGVKRSTAGFKDKIENEDLGNLERQGFAQLDPSAAAPGDLVVWDSTLKDPRGNPEAGHRAIVYSSHEASADDKAVLEKKHLKPWQGGDYSVLWAVGATIYILELDSSWGSGGDPTMGGIQRRTFWYSPAGPKWAWTTDDPGTTYADKIPYNEPYNPHKLRGTGFYRRPSRVVRGPSPAGPTAAFPQTP